MKSSRVLIIFFVLLFASVSSCEKQDSSIISFEDSTLNATIVGFVSEKCYCCWGWQIKIGNQIIKTDLLPDISAIGYIIDTPIPVIIQTGKIKINCGNNLNYYEIKSLTIR
jgi:hypothetical protein